MEIHRTFTFRSVFSCRTARFFVNYHMKKNKEQASLSSNPCILEIWIREGDKDVKDIITMSADMILAGIDTVG